MATIVVQHDPSGIVAKDIHEVSGCVIEWILEAYPRGFEVPTKVYRNGPSCEIDLRDFPNGLVTDDIIIIAHQPAGVDPITQIILTIEIGKAVVEALTPSIEYPEDIDVGTAGSPNNKINGQTNIARALEKIPQIYGTVKSFPDIIFPSFGEWVSNEYVLTEYFMLSEGDSGDSTISNVKRENTELFNDPPYSIYPPGTPGIPADDAQNNGWVNTDLWSNLYDLMMLNVRQIVGTNDLYLKGDNIGAPELFVQLFGSEQIFRQTNGYRFNVTTNGANDLAITRNLELLTQGDILKVSDSVLGTTVNYTFVGFTKPFIGTNTNIDVELDATLTPTGLLPSGSVVLFENTKLEGTGTREYGPFSTPIECDEIWVDLSAPSGLYAGSNPESATIVVEYKETGTTSPTYITNTTLSGSSSTPIDQTFKIDAAGGKLFYDVTVYRSDAQYLGNDGQSKVYCGGIKAVEKLNSLTPDDQYSTLLVRTKVSSNALRSGKVNAIYSRGIPIFNYATKTFGAEAETSRFDLILLHHMINVAGVPLSQINVDDLESIATSPEISDPKLLEFNYTMSGKNTPLDDDVNTICNAARVTAYKQGSIYRFYRDESKTVTMVLGLNDKLPNSDLKTFKASLLNDFDGIELEYKNADNDFTTEIINVPASGSLRRKKIVAVGVTNSVQAQNRAEYEWNIIQYRRYSFKTEVTRKGVIPDLGDVVRISDDTRIDGLSGEILKIDGSNMTLTQRFEPDGTEYEVFFNDTSSTAFATSDPNVLFFPVAGHISGLASRGDNGYQRGDVVLVRNKNGASDTAFREWVLTDRRDSDDAISLEFTQYDERVYDGD